MGIQGARSCLGQGAKRQMHYKIQSGLCDQSQKSVEVDRVPHHLKDVHSFPESYSSGNEHSTEENVRLIQVGTSYLNLMEIHLWTNHLQINQLYQVVYLSLGIDTRAPHKFIDNQARAIHLIRSMCHKRPALGCTFCDHKIKVESGEIGSGKIKLPLAKRPQCPTCLVGAAICNLGKVHTWFQHFKNYRQFACGQT